MAAAPSRIIARSECVYTPARLARAATLVSRDIGSATAACDKAIAISYERPRPSEKILDDWIARCRMQRDAALVELGFFSP